MHIAPLVIFRILFGGLLLYSTLRTIDKGWIHELYIEPVYHFSFFSWLQPLDEGGMYVVFATLAITAIGIMIGFLYRLSTALHLLLFLYVELLDKTYYLNHYYLVTLLVFWLMLVPAHRYYSVDALLFPSIRTKTCYHWQILIFKAQLSIVYFFAGIAKINPDWILRAEPMATWLPGKYELPILGQIVHLKEVAYLFSWAGCLYDTTIWIFLWIKKTRVLAYIAVLVFHILTGILFPRIGMFPYIMIISTIIFFSTETHQKVLARLPFSGIFENESTEIPSQSYPWQKGISGLLVAYFIIQLWLPFRYLQYPGHLFWHERGYRFSWRVMLMEKNGYTSFVIEDPKTNIRREVDQSIYLTAFQRQQLRSQPDMIFQFAQFLGDEFTLRRGHAPRIYVDSRISLNARRSQPFVDTSVDLYALQDADGYSWLIPLKQ